MARILVVNLAFAAGATDPVALLDGYPMLTGWCDALRAAGASHVSVLQRFGHDVEVERGGVRYQFCGDRRGPTPQWWSWLPALYRRAADLRPDVVHLNGVHLSQQWWWLRRYLPSSSTLVVQDHAGRPASFDGGPIARAARLAERRTFAVADGFLFTARELAIPWQGAGLIAPWQPVFEVPAATTTIAPVPRDEARQSSGIAGHPSLVWVGRLAEVKDPLTVLDGVAEASRRVPGLSLTMVHNGGELLEAVRARVESQEELRDRVRLVSNVDHAQLASWLCAADLFALGSRHEACGQALIEALACGTWPVVPDIPAFTALTGGGRFGTLWPPGNARAFADALVRAAPGAEARRTRVLEHFRNTLAPVAVGHTALAAYASAADLRAARRSTPAP